MDDPYDSNKNFKYLYEKKILPGIRKEKLDYFNQEEHQYKKQRKKLHHNNNILIDGRRKENMTSMDDG